MLRLLLFLTLALRLSAQETMFRQVADTATDTHVEVVALFTRPAPGGYLPVRVKIANNLASSKTAYLDFDSTIGYGDDLKTRSSFSFTVDGGKVITRDIMVPTCSAPEANGTCTLTATLNGQFGKTSNSLTADFATTQPAVLLSESLFTPFASTLDGEANSKFSGSRGSTVFAGKFDPKQLADDWLAFSAYDSVVMTDSDWSAVPPGSRNAILSWVRLGGQLVVYAAPGTSLASLDLPAEAGFGSIVLPAEQPTAATAKIIFDEVMKNSTAPRQSSITSDFAGAWPLQIAFGLQQFRYGLFIGVLVLFAIIVGPVNLFVFAKAGKRHRLFITTPIISLATSLILVGLIILQDGFGGSGFRRVLMEVRPDAGLNAAYIRQEQFSRTGVLTGSGFTLEIPANIVPVPIAPNRWARYTSRYNAKGVFDLQPESGKTRASGTWFQSRSEQGQSLAAVVSTRGRIEATAVPGEYLSTFDFPIETFYQLDASGQWSRATDIQAGKRFRPTPVDPTMAGPELLKLANGFTKRNKRFLESASKRPNHFVAVTTQAPGIATSPSIRWKQTTTVITGPVVVP